MTATTTPPAALAIAPFLTPLVEGNVHIVDLVSEPTKVDSLTITPASDEPFLKRHRLILAVDGSTPLAALTAHEYFGANSTHIFIDKVDTSGLGTHRGLARALVTAYLQSTAAALASTPWYLHVYAKSAQTYLLPTQAGAHKRVLNDAQLTQWWQAAVDAALWGHPLERFCFQVGSGAAGARRSAAGAWASGFPAALYAPEANPQAVVLDLPDHELARLAKADTAKGVETLSELLTVWQGLVEAKGGDEQPACLTVHVSPKIGEEVLQQAVQVEPVEGKKVESVVKTLLAHKWGGEGNDAAAKALEQVLKASGVSAVQVPGTRVQKQASKASPVKQQVAVNTLNATLIKKKRTADQPASPNKKAKIE